MAKNAIGNFILKSDPENISFERHPTKSTIVKYLELKRLRDEIERTKRDFNEQVFAARQQKLNLCDYIGQQLKKLHAIQVEIPADRIKTVKITASIDENVEFLDQKFGLASSFVDGETHVFSKTESLHKNDVKSDFYQAILQMRTTNSPVKCNKIETELQQLRLRWKIFEQNVIIDEIHKRITEFDEHLLMLRNRRLEIALEVNFMELYYFTVYQELMVLKNFEKSQILVMQDIEASRFERDSVEAKITSENAILNELQQHADELEESLNDVERLSIENSDDEFATNSEMAFHGNGT